MRSYVQSSIHKKIRSNSTTFFVSKTKVVNNSGFVSKTKLANMTHFALNSLYEFEININKNIQKHFEFTEALLRHINIYLEPSLILDIWIPLVGAFNHKLLIQLVSSLSVINVLATLIKWCSPEFRPIWWIKEQKESDDYDDIVIDPYSCDTSAGFPSTHAVTFTAFICIIVWHLLKSSTSKFIFGPSKTYFITYGFATFFTILLWLSRLYFLYEFLHQCILGSLLAIGLVQTFECFSKPLMNLSKWKALFTVLSLGILPINAYFTMLINDVDPFWSVRMAFKWCPDPLYLKHETTPVFTLCRDFGYLLGVALSCPLAKHFKSAANIWSKRFPIILIMEFCNYFLRSLTPKQYGRFAFVAYEFLRNFLHTFTLLTILPKFVKK